MKTKFLALIATALAVAGCASLGNGSAVETIAVQYAVLRVTDGDSAKAGRIAEIATEAKSLFNSEAVTVALVKTAVASRVAKLDLAPADQLLAAALIEAVEAELVKRVGNGLLPPEKKVGVNAVLDAVIQAATIAKG